MRRGTRFHSNTITNLGASIGTALAGAVLISALTASGLFWTPLRKADAVVEENADARIKGLRAAVSVLAVVALLALFLTRRIPTRQPSMTPAPELPS